METLSSQILQNPSHRHPPSQSPPYSLPPPPPIFQPSPDLTLEDRISPSILLIIIILAIIFFVSGLLHLLVRFLFRPHARHPDVLEHDVTALQGQLQQLFHLHDAGVDQSFIDTLPVFHYKAIIGVKDPFDCAVCLCEFEPDDKLRLLPKCSHAFHMECIDTWLLSHSTCPLCRASLLPDFSSSNAACTPIVCILEAGGDSSRELGNGVDIGRTNSSMFGSNRSMGVAKEPEISVKEGEEGGKIVTVKLGKFKNVDGSGESSSDNSNNNSGSNNVDSRRCFSMGSFAYVMDETTSLQVPIMTPAAKKQRSTKKTGFLPLKPGHKSAISEYGSDSRREFSGINGDARGKGESFSISKRAFSFRFPIRTTGNSGRAEGGASAAAAASRRRTISEMEDMAWWENAGSEMNLGDEETQSCYSVESSSTSYRRTLLWLMGRQQHNKVIHSSSFSSNV